MDFQPIRRALKKTIRAHRLALRDTDRLAIKPRARRFEPARHHAFAHDARSLAIIVCLASVSFVALPSTVAIAQQTETQSPPVTDAATEIVHDEDRSDDDASRLAQASAACFDEDAPAFARLKATYDFATNASSRRELDIVIEACTQLLELNITTEQQAHTMQLQAWAHFRQGDKWIDEAVRAFGAGAQNEQPSVELEQASEQERASAESSVTDGAGAAPKDEFLTEHQRCLDMALAAYDLALASNPELGRAHHGRGIVFAMRGDWGAAAESFEIATLAEPSFASAWFNLGECRMEMNEFEAAATCFTKGLELRSQDAAGYTGRGHAYLALGEYPRALLDFRRCVQLDPHNTRAKINRGDAYMAVGEWSKALEDYQAARTEDSVWSLPSQRLAWLLSTCPDLRVRNEAAAYEFALQAIEMDGRANALTLDTLAAAQAANGWFEDAVASLELIPTLHPEGLTADREDRLTLYESRRPYQERSKLR